MKIDLAAYFSKVSQTTQGGGKECEKAERDFSKILESVLGNPVCRGHAAPATVEMKGCSKVEGVEPVPIERSSRLAWYLEDVLDVVENYAQTLADPACSLESIAPYINRMALEQEKIWSLMNGLAAEDGLREVAREVLVTLSAEMSRFERGDYV
ncbi:hypothetical protein TRIP_B200582 [uncultured Desulfatiglans sp.]|uniref:Uncharacterized protein n=1 Tax=Uncultured Desulfatiglans sp. TaxID=1748965 RepID=A0A653A458_UNCDX|nr:hypothetical protein TRIP_B200582 [uncultured Desulfatiglans sp.]